MFFSFFLVEPTEIFAQVSGVGTLLSDLLSAQLSLVTRFIHPPCVSLHLCVYSPLRISGSDKIESLGNLDLSSHNPWTEFFTDAQLFQISGCQ